MEQVKEISRRMQNFMEENAKSQSKTYRNEEWRFEFQYPKRWTIVREDKSVNYYSRLLLEISAPVIFMDEKRFDSAFLVNIVLPEFIHGFDGLEKNASEITINNIKGIKYEYVFNNFPETAVILPFGELRMILGTGSGSKQYLDEFNQILTSFKFLK
ncbi:MAG: PsbP-related protein [bacterium]